MLPVPSTERSPLYPPLLPPSTKFVVVLTVPEVPVVLNRNAPLPVRLPGIAYVTAVVPVCAIVPPPVPTATFRPAPRSIAVVPLYASRPPLLNATLFPAAPLPRLFALLIATVPPPMLVTPVCTFGPTSVSVDAPLFAIPVTPVS